MKKLIKMLSYSKEGRNIIRLLLLSWVALYQKKRCYLSFILTFCFSFLKNETIFKFIYLILVLKERMAII